MRAHRLLWGAVVAVLTTAAVDTMVDRSEPSHVLALVVALGSLGAVLGLGWGPELTTVRHPVLLGTSVGAAGSLAVPGLVGLAGWWAIPVCALLIVCSPYTLDRLRARAAVAGTDPGVPMDEDAHLLRADWEATTRALAAGPTVKDHLLLAQLRGWLLVEIRAHHGGVLPAYVWEPYRDREPDGRERSGPGPRELEP